jgi:hypothetical protein
MKPGVAGTLKKYRDKTNPRVPYHIGEDGNCHDCNTPAGGLHHPGCDTERCADCGGQAIGCDCLPVKPKIERKLIEDILERNASLCMDVKAERRILAMKLTKAINIDLIRP